MSWEKDTKWEGCVSEERWSVGHPVPRFKYQQVSEPDEAEAADPTGLVVCLSRLSTLCASIFQPLVQQFHGKPGAELWPVERGQFQLWPIRISGG